MPTTEAPILPVADAAQTAPLMIRLQPDVKMTDDQFFEFCQINQDLRIERNAQREILIMPPTGYRTGRRNARITSELQHWADEEGRGEVADSSTGFKLPNGATRSPDAAWTLRTRLESVSGEQQEKFLPLCPDFVIELHSGSDRLSDIKDKMQEYLDNGARLGWLIDPYQRRVYVYRPGAAVQVLDDAETVSGDPVLSGFVLDLRKIW